MVFPDFLPDWFVVMLLLTARAGFELRIRLSAIAD